MRPGEGIGTYSGDMFVKITRSGPRSYVKLAEAFRDDAGKARHRTPVTLGRLDQLSGSLDAVISGLLKAADQVINKNAICSAFR